MAVRQRAVERPQVHSSRRPPPFMPPCQRAPQAQLQDLILRPRTETVCPRMGVEVVTTPLTLRLRLTLPRPRILPGPQRRVITAATVAAVGTIVSPGRSTPLPRPSRCPTPRRILS